MWAHWSYRPGLNIRDGDGEMMVVELQQGNNGPYYSNCFLSLGNLKSARLAGWNKLKRKPYLCATGCVRRKRKGERERPREGEHVAPRGHVWGFNKGVWRARQSPQGEDLSAETTDDHSNIMHWPHSHRGQDKGRGGWRESERMQCCILWHTDWENKMEGKRIWQKHTQSERI